MSRRRLLAAGGGAVLAGTVMAQVADAQADKPRRSPWDLTFDVAMDEPPAAAVPAAPVAPASGVGAPVAPSSAVGAPIMPAPAIGAPVAPAGGAYYMSGGVFGDGTLAADGTVPSGAARIGTYRMWGWNFDPARATGGSVTNMVFELIGRGQILTGGLTGSRVAVLAGTGEFRGANGQADLVTLGTNAWRIIFDYSTPYEGT